MDYKIILSPRAIQDLQEVVRYIAWDNPVQAEKFGHLLIGRARSLNTFPERGRVVPEIGNPAIREIIFKSYRIIYRIQNETRLVEISRIWHGARGVPEIS